MRVDQTWFIDCSNDTFTNPNIAGCRLTAEFVNNQHTANYQVVHSCRSSEISLAKLVGLVAQSAKLNDTF